MNQIEKENEQSLKKVLEFSEVSHTLIIGTKLNLVFLLFLFIFGTIGNFILFIRNLRNHPLLCHKLHLINLIINNLFILLIVLVSNALNLIRTKPVYHLPNQIHRNISDARVNHINYDLKRFSTSNINDRSNDEDGIIFSIYKRLILCEKCETESAIVLISFFCHLFNFLLFSINHKQTIERTRTFYSKWFVPKDRQISKHCNENEMKQNELLKKIEKRQINRQQMSTIDQLTGKQTKMVQSNLLKNLLDQSNLTMTKNDHSEQKNQTTTINSSTESLELINQQTKLSQSTRSKFSGQTLSDIMRINIRNFVLCFLTAWTITFCLAALNDLSDQQFSACALKAKLVAVHLKDFILIQQQTLNKHQNLTDDQMMYNRDEMVDDNQLITNRYFKNLVVKLNQFRNLKFFKHDAFKFAVLLVQFIVIISVTFLTILNLIEAFFKNRKFRTRKIVPQCYTIQSDRKSKRNEFNQNDNYNMSEYI